MTKQNRLKVRAKKATFILKAIRISLPFLFCVIFYEMTVRCVEPKLLPIRHVKLASHLTRVDSNSLRVKVNPFIKGFFSTNVTKLKDEIQQVPFVGEVSIKRLWPDTLQITVNEIKLIAAWGKDRALTSRGEVVSANLRKDKQLPIFNGPDEKASDLLAVYNELSEILSPYDLKIKGLALNNRQSWEVALDNGIKIMLGRKDIAQHLNSFLGVYPKIKTIHGDNIGSIDLRHSNGVAITLRKEIAK
jgi:cell division protein FtsQ